MLEELDQIDWGTLCHAYGPADDVPGLLRALTSSDKAIRDNAIYELYGNIWHQGTVYEATAYAVPFLIELLNSPATPDRSSIAGLLASIAAGSGYLEVHARPDWGEKQWRSILAEKGQTLEDERNRELATTALVRAEAQKAIPFLISFLNDPEPEIRAAIAEALAAFAEYRTTHLTLLQQALAVEVDEDVRERMEECIAQLTSV